MNKKILIGSIIAVAILILVSFTGVVGYQTTKSSTIAKASPLFTVRSSRAIDEESEDIRAYIEMKSDEDCGCDDDIGWSFPITCLILLILFEFIVSHSPYPVPLMCHVIMFIAQIFGCKDFP